MSLYFFSAIFVWLISLSFFIFKINKHYQNLVNGTKKERLNEVLDELLKNDQDFLKETEDIKKTIKKMIEESKYYFYKVGMVRFNPFEKSGGEQSFVIAFLDKQNNGIVINFIYTRDGLRTYSKKVKNGKGQEYDLSEEEQKAIEKSN